MPSSPSAASFRKRSMEWRVRSATKTSLRILCLCECVIGLGLLLLSSPANGSRHIIGGTPTDEPLNYVVSLRLKKDPLKELTSHNLLHICGGAFVDWDIVATAAHCFDPPKHLGLLQQGRYYVVGGTNLLHFNGTTSLFVSKIEEIITHPNYRKDPTLSNDVALLRISKRHNLEFLHLASRTKPGETCRVMGWGVNDYKEHRPSEVLHTADVPIVERSHCRRKFADLGWKQQITADILCAGHKEGGKDACRYDSGGPLVCNAHLAGIVSWGYKCAEPDRPGLYANVPYLRKWMLDNIKELQKDETNADLPADSEPTSASSSYTDRKVGVVITLGAVLWIWFNNSEV